MSTTSAAITDVARPTPRRRENYKVILDQAELDHVFFDNSGGRFPPVLNVTQAAELLGVSVKTIYDWSSKGRLRRCSRRRGKRLYFWRDRLIREVFEGKEWKP